MWYNRENNGGGYDMKNKLISLLSDITVVGFGIITAYTIVNLF